MGVLTMTASLLAELLKPCPFCGGRAEFKQGHYTGYVMCLKCEVMGPNIVEAEAIAAWNSRPSDPRRPEESALTASGSECVAKLANGLDGRR